MVLLFLNFLSWCGVCWWFYCFFFLWVGVVLLCVDGSIVSSSLSCSVCWWFYCFFFLSCVVCVDDYCSPFWVGVVCVDTGSSCFFFLSWCGVCWWFYCFFFLRLRCVLIILIGAVCWWFYCFSLEVGMFTLPDWCNASVLGCSNIECVRCVWLVPSLMIVSWWRESSGLEVLALLFSVNFFKSTTTLLVCLLRSSCLCLLGCFWTVGLGDLSFQCEQRFVCSGAFFNAEFLFDLVSWFSWFSWVIRGRCHSRFPISPALSSSHFSISSVVSLLSFDIICSWKQWDEILQHLGDEKLIRLVWSLPDNTGCDLRLPNGVVLSVRRIVEHCVAKKNIWLSLSC